MEYCGIKGWIGMPKQSKDGRAHMTYFDKKRTLSYVWDGRSDHIEVSHGGYGEPVFTHVPLSGFEVANGGIEDFAIFCAEWGPDVFDKKWRVPKKGEAWRKHD